MKIINKVINAFLVCLLCTGFSFSQTKLDKSYLSDYIQAAVDSFQLPGIAVGIIKNNEVIYANGCGVRSTITNEKVDTETLFGIASLSKAFTAASIGMLVDEGLLDWEDRVIDHLSWFKLYDSYITRELRINDLLCHRAGLQTFDGDLLWYGTNYSREEIVKRISELPVKNSFRSKYGYQNVMFIVAGEVIKAVSGLSWEEFVIKRIFKPIGMEHSTVTNNGFSESMNVAFPHLDGKVQEWISYDNSGPAAAINSCVNDMLKWTNFWIHKGVVGTDTLLSEKSYYTITRSYQALNSGKGEEIGGTHFSNTGLGWFLSDYSGRKVMAHGGGLPGFLSRIIVVPEDSLGIVVFQNDMEPVYSNVAKKILDLCLNDKDEDYISKALVSSKKYASRKEKSRQKRIDSRVDGTEPSFELEQYTGIYKDKMYGKAEIKLVDDELVFTMLPTRKLFSRP